jgi:hypothetical protein
MADHGTHERLTAARRGATHHRRMKLAAVLALVFGACIPLPHEVKATSQVYSPEQTTELEVLGRLAVVQQRIVDKLVARGFPLVDRQSTDTGILLKFAGNRDFSGTATIGSVFYAWITPDGPRAAKVKLVGKPTINHVEGCPALDGTSCKPLTTYLDWGIKGYEEAVAIHGVFSELQVDGVVPDLPERTAAQ